MTGALNLLFGDGFAYITGFIILALAVSGIFYFRFKKIFLSLLLTLAVYIFLWVTVVESHRELIMGNFSFWQIVTITGLFSFYYGLIGILFSLVRRLFRYETKKIFKWSLLALAFGSMTYIFILLGWQYPFTPSCVGTFAGCPVNGLPSAIAPI